MGPAGRWPWLQYTIQSVRDKTASLQGGGGQMDEEGTGLEPSYPGEAGPGPGAPLRPRPILEAGLVFAAFWLTAYLPGTSSAFGQALADPYHHLAMALGLLPKALLLLYLMARTDGLKAFRGLARPRPADLLGALAVAGGAFLAVLLPATLISLLSAALGKAPPLNPLLAAAVHPTAPALLLVPSVLFDCLCIGYIEELYFRIYLPHRLGQGGLRPLHAGIASVLLFASAHGAQGGLGLLMAAVLGAWFAWRRTQGAGIHELGLGHAFYDATVILATLYLRA